MAGYVDETQHPAAGQGLVGVTQFDGNPAQLLGGEPIGVDAGERLHQRRLAMVDVPGGADDHDGFEISFDVMRSLKLDASRLSSMPSAGSACGFMRKGSVTSREPGSGRSCAVL